METIQLKIQGTRPLLMHADVFADPLNPMKKAHAAVTSKRKKTDEDYEYIARSEWRGGMYFDDEVGPYIPGINLESCMVAGGKLSKLGARLKRSAEVMDDILPLEYSGPRDIEGLWRDGYYDARSVKVSQARLMRYRPMFRNWGLTCTIAYDPESIDKDSVIRSMRDGGMYCGIGDYRPKFGRFKVEG